MESTGSSNEPSGCGVRVMLGGAVKLKAGMAESRGGLLAHRLGSWPQNHAAVDSRSSSWPPSFAVACMRFQFQLVSGKKGLKQSLSIPQQSAHENKS